MERAKKAAAGANELAIRGVRLNPDQAATFSPDDGGKWFAVKTGNQEATQAALAGRRFGTLSIPEIRGYTLVRSADIRRDVLKLKKNPGATKILTRPEAETGEPEFAPIREEEIAKIGTGGSEKIVAAPRKHRGGKKVRKRQRAAWRKMRPNHQQIKEAA